MPFNTTIPDSTLRRLRTKFAAGTTAWRGLRAGRERPSDPGDFGIGRYHTSRKTRAKNYGTPQQLPIRFSNPLILTTDEAYTQIADRFGTISGIAGHPEHGAGDFAPRKQRATEATARMIAEGYDGVVAVNPKWSELEIVVFPQL